jgi:hypothetical protein
MAVKERMIAKLSFERASFILSDSGFNNLDEWLSIR